MMTPTNIILIATTLLIAASSNDALQIPTKSSQQQHQSLSNRRHFLNHVVVPSALVAATTVSSILVPSPSYAASDKNDATAQTISTVVGQKAPRFTLPNSRGEGATSLDQLVQSKKWTVLYFYPGAFTQGCTLEARAFQRDIDNYRQLNAQIVGVSVDPPEKNAQFCSSEGLDFYMLSDVGGRVSKLYGTALSIPGFGTFSNRQTYLIDPSGNLRYVFTDVESRIARHSGEVLEKLTELEQAKA